jgi:hypothetical protein
MQNSYRLTIRNAQTLSVVDHEQPRDNERLGFGSCFTLWMGLIAASWAAIAFVLSLI